METTRKLQRVGGSLALTIPAEIVRELGLSAEDEVSVVSDGAEFLVKRATPRPRRDVVEFMARFTDEYDEALKNLANR